MKLWIHATPAERIERWKNVERVLKAMTPHERRKHWDMSYWGLKTECGTVACAAGHCGLDPWFRRRKFILNLEDLDLEGSFKYGTPSDFFGNDGANSIFYNTRHRPVSKVIQEVHLYLIKLKKNKGKDFDDL